STAGRTAARCTCAIRMGTRSSSLRSGRTRSAGRRTRRRLTQPSGCCRPLALLRAGAFEDARDADRLHAVLLDAHVPLEPPAVERVGLGDLAAADQRVLDDDAVGGPARDDRRVAGLDFRAVLERQRAQRVVAEVRELRVEHDLELVDEAQQIAGAGERGAVERTVDGFLFLPALDGNLNAEDRDGARSAADRPAQAA